jgi:hypothetical protein
MDEIIKIEIFNYLTKQEIFKIYNFFNYEFILQT